MNELDLISKFEADTANEPKAGRRRSAQGLAGFIASHLTVSEVFDLLDALADTRKDRAEAWREMFGGAQAIDGRIPTGNTTRRDMDRITSVSRLDQLVNGRV